MLDTPPLGNLFGTLLAVLHPNNKLDQSQTNTILGKVCNHDVISLQHT